MKYQTLGASVQVWWCVGIVVMMVSWSARSYDMEQCSGALAHDVGSFATVERPYSGCSDNGVTNALGMIFEPPSLPWRLTKVCLMMILTSGPEGGRTEQVSVDIYPTTTDTTYGVPKPRGGRLYTKSEEIRVWPNTKTGLDEAVMQSINVSYVTYGKHQLFWVAASFPACNGYPLSMLGNRNPGFGDGLVYAKISSSSSFSSFVPGTNGKAEVYSLGIRVSGEPYAPLIDEQIPGWTCAREAYRDGEVCDCGCGLEDPDCAQVTRISPNCSEGQICYEGTCVGLGWDTSRPECSVSGIGDGLCQCGCGEFVDPDCRTPFYQLAPGSCAGNAVPFCDIVTGQCKDKWLCATSRYDEGSKCDCTCGHVDPDCNDPFLENSCGGGLQCRCALCVAEKWNCTVDSFNDGVCQCGCGAYDPDCDDVDAPVKGCSGEGMVCAYDGTCVAPACGNHRADEGLGEECDGGLGCLEDCKCASGFQHSEPRRAGCVPQCGDGMVVEGEECEAGAVWCDNCHCPKEHTTIPGTGQCAGCGNNFLEADTESCDGGAGCAADCSCLAGFVPSSPPSVSCVSTCGNGVPDAAEECDGSLWCQQDCKCPPDHPANVAVHGACQGCGNGVLEDGEQCDRSSAWCQSDCTCDSAHPADPGYPGFCIGCGNNHHDSDEQCDGGRHCGEGCTCVAGYYPTSPASVDCAPVCNDGILGDEEECDSSPHCDPQTCKCSSGYTLTSRNVCSGCGNGAVDSAEEQCDSGSHCLSNCTCEFGYKASTPQTTDCVTNCGDGYVTPEEVCDGSQLCNNATCQCEGGNATTEVGLVCIGCGNGRLDAGEDCDSGTWCNKTSCKCTEGHPVSTDTPGLCTGCGNLVTEKGEECEAADENCDAATCKCAEGLQLLEGSCQPVKKQVASSSTLIPACTLLLATAVALLP